MSNLPPGVSISDSDAPWNQDYPEPTGVVCENCRFGEKGFERRGEDCPECGEKLVLR